MKTDKKATRTRRTTKEQVSKTTDTVHSAGTTDLSPDNRSERRQLRRTMIEQAAYFKAEQDGFRVDAVAYWLAAEKEVDACLSTASKRVPGGQAAKVLSGSGPKRLDGQPWTDFGATFL